MLSGKPSYPSENKDRIFYFDFLKVIACIAVIFIHTTASWANSSLNSFDWISSTFYSSFSRWSVPVFFMVSGSLLLGNTARLSIERLYKKSILRFCTATFFWSAVYAIFDIIFGNGLKTAIGIFIGGKYHMWFMFAIIGLYVFAPILNTILENKKTLHYSLVVFFVFPFFMGMINVMLSPGIPHTQFIFAEIGGAINKLGFLAKTEFIFYFLLGYYLHHTNMRKKTEKTLIILGTVALVFTFLFTVAVSFYSNETNQIFHDANTINVLLSSVAIFIFAKKYIVRNKFSTFLQKIITLLSNNSFGIYLSHALVLELLDHLGLIFVSLPAILYIPLIVITVLIFSTIISFILSSVPLLKKWII